VLLEARARVRVERHRRGLPGPNTPRDASRLTPYVQSRHRRLYQLHVPMPAEIFAAWKDECAFRGIEGSAILRSVIHSYLLSSHEPEGAVSRWYWKGRLCEMGRNGARPFERAVIPRGANRALKRRAHQRGTTVLAIVRALVLEVLDGKHRKLVLIDAPMMFDDEERYSIG